VQSDAEKIQSQAKDSETCMFDENETMSPRDKRRLWSGKTSVIDREEEEKILNYVNTSEPDDNLVQINGFQIPL
jgi:hypothetical protein